MLGVERTPRTNPSERFDVESGTPSPEGLNDGEQSCVPVYTVQSVWGHACGHGTKSLVPVAGVRIDTVRGLLFRSESLRAAGCSAPKRPRA